MEYNRKLGQLVTYDVQRHVSHSNDWAIQDSGHQQNFAAAFWGHNQSKSQLFPIPTGYYGAC